MEEFINYFYEILEEPDAVTLSKNTIFKEIDEWSSLTALSLIGMIDENYDVTIGADDMRACQTIEDLYNKVQSKK